MDFVTGDPRNQWVLNLRLLSVDNGTARITCQPNQRPSLALAQGVKQKALEQLLREATGHRLRLDIVPPRLEAAEEGPVDNMAARREAMALPLVRQVMEMFDAAIVDVRRSQPQPARAEASPQDEDAAEADTDSQA